MHQNHPIPDNEQPAQRLAQETVVMTSPTHSPADQLQVRRLEKMGWSPGERLRFLWYRLRLTIAEMNYATRRMVELQANHGTQAESRQPRRQISRRRNRP
jgi:hypothetical protein